MPKSADPYIERWPPSICARRGLFQWPMVENEVGQYDNNYPDYQPYQSSQPILMQHLPERYGRDAYQHLMQSKELRIEQITSLLARSGVNVEASDDAWHNIFQWLGKQFVSSTEPAALAHGSDNYIELKTRPIVYSLISDVGLLLGEHTIQRRPDFQWMFWGDVPVDKSAGLGRVPWILCEPLPVNGRFKEPPARFLPKKLVSAAASSTMRSTTNSGKPMKPTRILTHLCE